MTFGRYGLMPLVAKLLHDHPAVEVDLTLSDKLSDPVEEGYEALVRIGPLDEDLPLVARPLRDDQLVACASPRYLATDGMPQVPSDLARHECLDYIPWHAELNRRWRFTREGQPQEAEVRSRLNLNDWGAIHSAALAGFGIALGYEQALAPDIAAGRLVPVLPDFDGPARPMHLLYAADRRMTPKLRTFIDLMVEAFGRDDV